MTGDLDVLFGQGIGSVFVDGPGHLDGQLQLGEDGAVDGRIGGHFVNAPIGDWRAAARVGTRAERRGARLADIGAWLARVRRAAGRPVAG